MHATASVTYRHVEVKAGAGGEGPRPLVIACGDAAIATMFRNLAERGEETRMTGVVPEFEHTVGSWATRFAEERNLEVAALERMEGLGPRIEQAILRGIDQGLILVNDSGTFRMKGDPRDRELNFLYAANLDRRAPGPSRPALSWEWYVKVAAYVELVELGWPNHRLALQGDPTGLVDVTVTRGDGSVPLVVEARRSVDELRQSLAGLNELSYEQWREPVSRDGRKLAAWTCGHEPAECVWARAPELDEVYDIDYLQRVPRLVPGGQLPTPE